MDMEAVAHRLVLLIVDLQEQHIWVLLRNLADLHGAIILRTEHSFRQPSHRKRNKIYGELDFCPIHTLG
jgi:hypothetical protein